jgi:chemotaxis protein methyltransferase CheR
MDDYFDHIAGFLLEKSRLSFAGHKRSILRSRLVTRLEQLQLADFAAYWELLQADRVEVDRLFDLVTTNETSFFRNEAQFICLKEQIIPDLVRRAEESGRRLRMLSAGCSTGEEPYSLAMTFLDAVDGLECRPPEIVAGDISDSCLKTAQEGYYDADRLQKLPAGYRDRFMVRAGDGARVGDAVRRAVRFIRLNLHELMQSESPSWTQGIGLFDIIFCRNVMIYFAASCQQQLVETLYKLLQPGGYLLTGDAEPLHLFNHEFMTVKGAGCLIYKKNGDFR